jgi:hypothetical protein
MGGLEHRLALPALALAGLAAVEEGHRFLGQQLLEPHRTGAVRVGHLGIMEVLEWTTRAVAVVGLEGLRPLAEPAATAVQA